MRCAMAHPCAGSRMIVFRIRRSRVPWTRSVGLLTRRRLPSVDDRECTKTPVNKQGEGLALSVRNPRITTTHAVPGVCAAHVLIKTSATHRLKPKKVSLKPRGHAVRL